MPDMPPGFYLPAFGGLCLVISVLAGVIAYQNKVTIPGIVLELRAATEKKEKVYEGYLTAVKTMAPLVQRCVDLIERCHDSCPAQAVKGGHKNHERQG